MDKIKLILLTIYAFLPIIITNECAYKPCPTGNTKLINLHFVPHTHLDPGWLKTFEQYYKQEVRHIINNVIESLSKNPARKFIWTETSFLARWWLIVSQKSKDQLLKLVNNGQFQFVSGGWTMNDEATTHYSSIIDTITIGVNWLKAAFGKCGRPSVQWQVDQFGHSSEMASILSLMQFDAQIIGRIDDDVRRWMKINQTMEFLWQSNPVLKEESEIFTTILYNHYYVQDPCYNLPCYVTDRVVKGHYDMAIAMNNTYRTNHILMPFGTDFAYSNAESVFAELDTLIETLNNEYGNKLIAYYSTPACYIKALHEDNILWPMRIGDDFFPYVSYDGNEFTKSYWTGFFSSRPTFKHLLRHANGFLQATKQIMVLTGLNTTHKGVINPLIAQIAISVHHDAITGTSRQTVMDAYSDGLNRALVLASNAFTLAFLNVLEACNYKDDVKKVHVLQDVFKINVDFWAKSSTIIIYNPLGYSYTHIVRIPIKFSGLTVFDSNNNQVKAVILKIDSNDGLKTDYDLAFEAKLKPFSLSSFIIKPKGTTNTLILENRRVLDKTNSISNKFMTIKIDPITGLTSEVVLATGTRINFEQNFFYYTPTFNSGAYVLHVEGRAKELSSHANVTFEKGDGVEEIHQRFNPFIVQVIRLYSNLNYIELEWIVGPIEDGKDILTRYDSSIDSGSNFFTDSNGRQSILRTFKDLNDEALNVQSNYQPVSSWIYIQDQRNDLQMTVIPDRSEGGSSLKNGSIELIVHRRILTDDYKGMDEAFDERGENGEALIVRGRHYVIIGNPEESKQSMNLLSRRMVLKPVMMYTNQAVNNYKFNAFNYDLHTHIHILTLEELEDEETLLFRIENTCSKADTKKSCHSKVDLETMFKTFTVLRCFEMDLSGYDYLELMQKNRFSWSQTAIPSSKFKNNEKSEMKPPFKVYLDSMEIRTFIIKVKHHISNGCVV